jgi:hypothetical protein
MLFHDYEAPMVLSALLLALFACSPAATDTSRSGGGGSDDSGDSASGTSLVIDQPTAGAEFDAGTAIPLDVRGLSGGQEVTPQSVEWAIGTWRGAGAHTSAPGLDPGAYEVRVTAMVDGNAEEATVAILVVPGTIAYTGTLTADVTVTTDFGDIDASCSGPLDFTATRRTSAVAGGGTAVCRTEFGDQDLPYSIEGTLDADGIRGDLILTADGQSQRTPFTGTGSYGAAVNATFDGTFSNGDGSLRLQGSFAASPQ